jgi:hypothetical protein
MLQQMLNEIEATIASGVVPVNSGRVTVDRSPENAARWERLLEFLLWGLPLSHRLRIKNRATVAACKAFSLLLCLQFPDTFQRCIPGDCSERTAQFPRSVVFVDSEVLL